MIASALCIVIGSAEFAIPATSFTLRWQHTIEKVLWEEDYLIAGSWLFLRTARVRGSAAGMEPPADSVKIGDAWEYRPRDRWHRRVTLARSTVGTDYELCVSGACRPLAVWAPAPLAPTSLSACDAESDAAGLR